MAAHARLKNEVTEDEKLSHELARIVSFLLIQQANMSFTSGRILDLF